MEDVKEGKQYVSVNGGLLVQDQDLEIKELSAEMAVTKVKPTEEQLADLFFAWKIVSTLSPTPSWWLKTVRL